MKNKPPIPELIPDLLMPDGYCEQLSNAVIARMNQSKQQSIWQRYSAGFFSAAAGMVLLISAFLFWYMKPESPNALPFMASESIEEYILNEENISESDLLLALTGEDPNGEAVNEYELFYTLQSQMP